MTSSVRERIIVLAGLALLVLLAHGRTLGNGFVYDDHRLVERNPLTETLDPWKHLTSPFSPRIKMSVEYWRPAATWSLALDRRVAGLRPSMFHATNLALHVLACSVLFLVVGRLAGRTAAIVAGGLFAVHPVTTEAVAWVMGRSDLLATLGVLVAVHLHTGVPDAPRGSGAARYAAALGATLAALLSKESAVTFPVWILATDLASGRTRGLDVRQSWRFVWARARGLGPGYLAVLVVWFVARALVVGAPSTAPAVEGAGEVYVFNPLAGAPASTRVLTSPIVMSRAVELLVVPWRLSVDYSFAAIRPATSPADARLYLAIPLVVAFGAALIAAARRHSSALFGALAGAASWAPFAQIAFAAPVLLAERTLHLPAAGFAAAAGAVVASGASRWGPRGRSTALTVVLTAAILAPLAARSLVRAADWKDDLRLNEAVVSTYPDCAMAWNRIGLAQEAAGRRDEAVAAYDRALAIVPGFSSAALNRAEALQRAGRSGEAESALREALTHHPEHARIPAVLARIVTERGDAAETAGRVDEARAALLEGVSLARRAVELTDEGGDPVAPAVLRLLAGQNLVRLGRLDEAGIELARVRDDLQRARKAQDDPSLAPGLEASTLGATGLLAGRRGLHAEAAADYARAAEVAERAGEVRLASGMRVNEGNAWLAASRPSEAMAAFDRTLALVPGTAATAEAARVGKARAMAAQGRTSEILATSDPASAGAPAGGGAAAATTGRSPKEILAAAEEALRSGHPDRALPLYDRLLLSDPLSMRFRHGRARARLALGDRAGAEKDLIAAVTAEGAPRNAAAAEIWYEAGVLAAARGDAAEARERFLRCLAIAPEHPRARQALGGSVSPGP